MSIRILLVDDHKIMREGLRDLLAKQKVLSVVGEAENGREAVRLARDLSPEIVIMDIVMPDMNGIDATRQILAENTDVRVVVLSMYSDKRYVIEMLRAGASAYMLKDCAFEELVTAIQAVMSRKVFLSSKINEIVIEDYINSSPKDGTSVFSVLSSREREVLQHIAEGKSTKETASSLCISVKTVEAHKKNIMDKLKIYTTADLTKYAIREGLVLL